MFVGHRCFSRSWCDQCNKYGATEEILDGSSPQKPLEFMDFASDVFLSRLDTDNLSCLPASLETDPSKKDQLASQGFFASPDESYACSHETSKSFSYWLNEKGLPYLINMDRGGVVTKQDGGHTACIADGVGGAGYFSAFVAHMICEYFLNPFSAKALNFTENMAQNQEIADDLFQELVNHIEMLSPNTLTGSSTALLVDCLPIGQRNNKQMYRIQVAAIGDCAVIHIDSEEKKASQLNKINRRHTLHGKPDVSSTGGHIRSSGGIRHPENIIAAISEASEDDYLILVTDGFLDNVRDGKVTEVIELVAFNPLFDQPFEKLASYKRFWECPRCSTLPTIENIIQFIHTNCSEKSPFVEKPTTAQIAKRLANYTKLVTYYRSQLEEAYYKTVPKKPMGSKSTHTSSNHDDDIPKTDDYMIITMKPSSTRK